MRKTLCLTQGADINSAKTATETSLLTR